MTTEQMSMAIAFASGGTMLLAVAIGLPLQTFDWPHFRRWINWRRTLLSIGTAVVAVFLFVAVGFLAALVIGAK